MDILSTHVKVGSDEASTAVEVLADGRVRVGGAPEPFIVTAADEGYYLVSDGSRSWRVAVVGAPDARFVGTGGMTARVEVEPEGAAPRKKARAAPDETAAPMPGTVIEIAVELGQLVSTCFIPGACSTQLSAGFRLVRRHV